MTVKLFLAEHQQTEASAQLEVPPLAQSEGIACGDACSYGLTVIGMPGKSHVVGRGKSGDPDKGARERTAVEPVSELRLQQCQSGIDSVRLVVPETDRQRLVCSPVTSSNPMSGVDAAQKRAFVLTANC